ncbi:SHD1 domain-containing protein [Aporhodopirellula aestuarii]|uniref:SHD1 domain-containing protein n=1 Tax=Aporhodopirellula aestuarii TaxID=2950107 RepID=A0ABT0U3M0_9BACT|nr:SHD1 domain-containing protein [Aporhodopirellula aestuarii]MCM2371259.1 SHD1 domain-containing protein [Aporhodopirellula aestuarii]
MLTLLALLTIFCAATASSSAEEPRVWKSADGKFSVEAEFVDSEDDIVRLRRADNNQTVSVPIEILSSKDQKYIRRRAEKSKDRAKPTDRRAAWMEGKWGFRFNMPGMKQAEALAEFDVQKMIDQIKVLDTAAWVQINITQGANGSFYTSPHAELAKHVSPDIVPQRDLFGEMLDALIEQDFKVMVYFATEGPTMGKHPDKALPGVIETWKEYAKSREMTPEQAVAEIIVKEYSLRYGTKISGWWFDHASYGDIKALEKAALAGNPEAVLTFNVGGSPELLTCPESDFTAGHPTPMKRHSPSWKGNEVAIKLIEKDNYINGSLGHFFPPMQETWNSGKPAFETEQAVDWTMRIVQAGGAITWAVALADAKGKDAPLASFQFKQLKAINEAVKKSRKQ